MYSTLDAHSRNCSACIKQRESCSGHHHERKKTSLQAERRKSSSQLRRSSSCLSSSSMTSSLREDVGEGSTYLTPTQRKNMEIKNLKLELERAKSSLDEKDREILILRKEVAALKEAQSLANSQLQESCSSWPAETDSVGDSGNCEELVETEESLNNNQEGENLNNNIENFDFELMESALKEEEEHRHQLEADNQELSSRVRELEQEVLTLTETHDKEMENTRKYHDEDVILAKKESSEKVEELIIELAGSSMRCARQQDVIEQKQLRIDELMQELAASKQREETNTKDPAPHLQYLKAEQGVNISSQTEHHASLLEAGTQTETGLSVEDGLEQRPSQAQSEESSCDNKIQYTYQFLRRSVYYYITDKENRAYHLRSIQRLLEFSDAELNLNPTRPVNPKRY